MSTTAHAFQFIVSHCDARARAHEKDTVVLRQGQRSDSLYLVEQGRLRVMVDGPGGKLKPVATIEEGDLFGAEAFFGVSGADFDVALDDWQAADSADADNGTASSSSSSSSSTVAPAANSNESESSEKRRQVFYCALFKLMRRSGWCVWFASQKEAQTRSVGERRCAAGERRDGGWHQRSHDALLGDHGERRRRADARARRRAAAVVGARHQAESAIVALCGGGVGATRASSHHRRAGAFV